MNKIFKIKHRLINTARNKYKLPTDTYYSILNRYKQRVTEHITIVSDFMKKLGYAKQGKLHDKSKWSKEEFEPYAIKAFGLDLLSDQDKIIAMDDFDFAWQHHTRNNPHHWEWWIDFALRLHGKFIPLKMRFNYVIEMVADYIGAGKIYMKDKFNQHEPLDFFLKTLPERWYHLETTNLLILLFTKYSDLGEDLFIQWFNTNKLDLQLKYKNKVFIKNILGDN